jgi:multimeric flavodoxin WrbA
LNDLKISPCQSTCVEYCKTKGRCKISDDMSGLYDKLYDTDAMVLGTPVYWWGPSAQMKLFIDRWYAFCHPGFAKKFEGKKLVLVAPFEDSAISTDPIH